MAIQLEYDILKDLFFKFFRLFNLSLITIGKSILETVL